LLHQSFAPTEDKEARTAEAEEEEEEGEKEEEESINKENGDNTEDKSVESATLLGGHKYKSFPGVATLNFPKNKKLHLYNFFQTTSFRK
jgi:hypothetical protein